MTQGVSYRVLGARLHRSESGLRHLCKAAKATVQDRFEAWHKKLSTRELVRRSIAAQEKQAAKEQEARDVQRTEEAKKGARIIRDWLKNKLPSSGQREQVIDEARRILAVNKRQGTLPKCAPPPPGTSVETIIQKTEPPWSVNPDAKANQW